MLAYDGISTSIEALSFLAFQSLCSPLQYLRYKGIDWAEEKRRHSLCAMTLRVRVAYQWCQMPFIYSFLDTII